MFRKLYSLIIVCAHQITLATEYEKSNNKDMYFMCTNTLGG